MTLSAGVNQPKLRTGDVRAAFATHWDRVVAMVVFYTYAAVVVLVCLRAAHQLSGTDLLRWICGAGAVIVATFALSSLPHYLRHRETLTRPMRRIRTRCGRG